MHLITVSVVLYTLFYTPCQIGALEWTGSLFNETQLDVCEGDTATFPWAFRLAAGEQVDTVSYHQQLQDGTSDKASESGLGDGMGTPIVSTDPHFTFTPDHQMIINRATANDTGNYVIKVMVIPAEETEAHPHVTRASLLVKVSPVLGEKGLQAELQSQAVIMTDGPQSGWHVQLSCGTFLSLGQPPMTVTWTTPSGTVLPSTSYENGVFCLVVANPVEPGDYSCQVDPQAPVLDCVSDKSQLRHQARVRVDAMEARVILLEARDAEQTALITELTARDTEKTAREAELTASMKELSTFVHDVHSKRAIFHAYLGLNRQLFVLETIKFTSVVANLGNAYNSTTGVFTVPCSGYYYLTATVEAVYNITAVRPPVTTTSFMLVDGLFACGLYAQSVTYEDVATCSFARHLKKSQKVWVAAWETSAWYDGEETTFSGFLLYPD